MLLCCKIIGTEPVKWRFSQYFVICSLVNVFEHVLFVREYLRHFQWMAAKYPVKQPLRALSEIMSKLLTQVDTDLRSKSQAYNNLKSNLQNMERKARLDYNSSAVPYYKELLGIIKKIWC